MGEVLNTLTGQRIFGKPLSMTVTIYGPNGPEERYPVDAKESVEREGSLYSYAPPGSPQLNVMPVPHASIAVWFDEFTKEQMLKAARAAGLSVHHQMSKGTIASAIQESDKHFEIVASMREDES